MPRRELGVRRQETGAARDGSREVPMLGSCHIGISASMPQRRRRLFTAGDAEVRRTDIAGTGKMAKVFVVGHVGQVEKWAVLLGFWGKMAKMANVAKHF